MPRPGAHVPAVLDATGETGVEARLGVTDTSVPGAQLAPMTMLHRQEEFEHECNLVEWEAGAVNRIPLIWDFMKTLGGCSESGNIFWRWEDKQLVSLLLEGWFGTPRFLSLRNKRSVLVGSPGIGKSTLLCVLAFYLVFKRKKSVLVYRKLQNDSVNCLFFLGYDGGESEDAGRVVFSTLLRCKYTTAADIYEGLIATRGAENIWLLLDGLDYNRIPEGLQSFKLLATSQQVDIKPYARDGTYRCLLSAWKREDIFKLGEELHHFSEEDMVERFYYSGGSVREFCRETVAEIKAVVDEVVELVENPGRLQLSERVELGQSQLDHLRRTFVLRDKSETKDSVLLSLCSAANWQQMIDSEYAVQVLSMRLRAESLSRMYDWAIGSADYQSLARSLFEGLVHSLAAIKKLKLFVSDYILPSERTKMLYTFEALEIPAGDAMRSVSKAGEYFEPLTLWRNDPAKAYWAPYCRDFPNITGIAKILSPTSNKTEVAYLQVALAKSHRIDASQLGDMNAMFFPAEVKTAGDTARPTLIILCPDKAACERVTLTTQEQVVAARKICRVCVGYCSIPLMTTRPTSLPHKKRLAEQTRSRKKSKQPRTTRMSAKP